MKLRLTLFDNKTRTLSTYKKSKLLLTLVYYVYVTVVLKDLSTLSNNNRLFIKWRPQTTIFLVTKPVTG